MTVKVESMNKYETSEDVRQIELEAMDIRLDTTEFRKKHNPYNYYEKPNDECDDYFANIEKNGQTVYSVLSNMVNLRETLFSDTWMSVTSVETLRNDFICTFVGIALLPAFYIGMPYYRMVFRQIIIFWKKRNLEGLFDECLSYWFGMVLRIFNDDEVFEPSYLSKIMTNLNPLQAFDVFALACDNGNMEASWTEVVSWLKDIPPNKLESTKSVEELANFARVLHNYLTTLSSKEQSKVAVFESLPFMMELVTRLIGQGDRDDYAWKIIVFEMEHSKKYFLANRPFLLTWNALATTRFRTSKEQNEDVAMVVFLASSYLKYQI